MAYLALYRKYRPTTFDELVGQEHIVRLLCNQIRNDRIGHAYLFCGARGTGKTTTAKIFAKAINCENPVDGSPCGKCKTCLALSDPSNIDIVEIDAASNNGVDDIRDMRDKVQYPPVHGRYKVYIIDEVHMMTTSAFNALLKTLEEPPRHVVFIFATTEVQKLPATILSRCMRVDFKLISTEKIAKLVASIYDDVGKDYESEAVYQIARSGEGSCRDALSLADMCLSYSDHILKYSDVLEVLGASDIHKVYALGDKIIAGDSAGALHAIDELLSLGKGVGVLNRDLIDYFRDLCVVRATKKANELLKLPADVFEGLVESSQLASYDKLLRCVELLSGMELNLRYTIHPRVLFESIILRAAKPETDENVEALSTRVAELEHQLEKLKENLFSADNQINNDYGRNNRLSENQIQENSTVNAELNRSQAKEDQVGSTEFCDGLTNPPEQDNIQDYPLPDDEFVPPLIEQDYPYTPKPMPMRNNSDNIPQASRANMNKTSHASGEKIVTDESLSSHSIISSSRGMASGSGEKIDNQMSGDPLFAGVKSSGNAAASKVWGGVLKKLRTTKFMLYTICRELNVIFEGETFVILATTKQEYEIMNKPINLDLYRELLSAEGITQFTIRQREEKQRSMAFENDESELKDLMGDKLKFE